MEIVRFGNKQTVKNIETVKSSVIKQDSILKMEEIMSIHYNETANNSQYRERNHIK